MKLKTILEQVENKITLEKVKNIANKLNISFDKFDINQLLKGVKVEFEEHGTSHPETNVIDNSIEKATKIALAHLRESPIYYDLLEKMEKNF